MAHCITFSLELWRIKWTLTKKRTILHWSIKLTLKSQSKHLQNKFYTSNSNSNACLNLTNCGTGCALRATSSAFCIFIFDIHLAEIGCDDSWFKWTIGNSFKFNICDSQRKWESHLLGDKWESARASDKNPIQYKLAWTNHPFKYETAMAPAVSAHMHHICAENTYGLVGTALNIFQQWWQCRTNGGRGRYLKTWVEAVSAAGLWVCWIWVCVGKELRIYFLPVRLWMHVCVCMHLPVWACNVTVASIK